MKILDCTLRDGGYYTNWNFSEELVLDYLKTMSSIGVNYVELGLRQFLKDEYVGPFGYTSDSYLEDLELPAGPKYGVMIDAGTILKNDSLSIDESIQKLFQEQSRSKITLVRIAAHPQEVPLAENIVNSCIISVMR